MSDAFLSVEGVTKRFRSAGGEVIALEDVSIAVERGECHAIIGESGSGKSTLGGLILGLFRANLRIGALQGGNPGRAPAAPA